MPSWPNVAPHNDLTNILNVQHCLPSLTANCGEYAAMEQLQRAQSRVVLANRRHRAASNIYYIRIYILMRYSFAVPERQLVDRYTF